jgi:hypothetical protein
MNQEEPTWVPPALPEEQLNGQSRATVDIAQKEGAILSSLAAKPPKLEGAFLPERLLLTSPPSYTEVKKQDASGPDEIFGPCRVK